MKRCSPWIGITLAAGLAAAIAPPAFAGPRLAVDPPVWDFGEVWYGTPLSGEVKLTNVGDEPLVIERIQKSCGCTAATPKNRNLAPGESTSMTVGYDSTQGRETVRQTVRIVTNDTANPQSTVLVQGTVKNVFEFEPGVQPAINFGSLTADAATSQTLKIKTTYPEKVKLELARDSYPNLEVDLKTVKPGELYELTATTVPPLNDQRFFRNIVLKTDLDFLDTLSVRVAGLVRPKVRVQPAQLFVSPKTVRPTERRLSVIYPEDSDLEITGIEASHPDVEWEIHNETVRSRGGYKYLRVDLTLPPGEAIAAAAPVTLTIKTNAPEEIYQKLEVPIRLIPVRTGMAPANLRPDNAVRVPQRQPVDDAKDNDS